MSPVVISGKIVVYSGKLTERLLVSVIFSVGKIDVSIAVMPL